jgi:hypothetical protein
MESESTIDVIVSWISNLRQLRHRQQQIHIQQMKRQETHRILILISANNQTRTTSNRHPEKHHPALRFDPLKLCGTLVNIFQVDHNLDQFKLHQVRFQHQKLHFPQRRALLILKHQIEAARVRIPQNCLLFEKVPLPIVIHLQSKLELEVSH